MQIVDSVKHNYFVRLLTYAFLACLSLPLLTSCESTKTIVNNLDEKEANEIVVFLANRGISADKVQAPAAGAGGGHEILYNIQVNESVSTEAMALLNDAGLPRKRGQNLLGIFQNTGLVPSEMQEQIRYQAGLAEGIASTIRKIDGILDAEVNISFPKEDPLNPGKTQGKITASVFVKHNGVLDDPNSHLITKIKRLVASSVTGLDYDNVTVIPVRARSSETALGPSTVNEEEKQYVNIWSIIIAKESVTRFRILFFSMSIILLLLIMGFIWLGWKFYPVIHKSGGFKELLTLQPIGMEKKGEEKKEGEKPEGKDEGKPPGEKSSVTKGMDET